MFFFVNLRTHLFSFRRSVLGLGQVFLELGQVLFSLRTSG